MIEKAGMHPQLTSPFLFRFQNPRGHDGLGLGPDVDFLCGWAESGRGAGAPHEMAKLLVSTRWGVLSELSI